MSTEEGKTVEKVRAAQRTTSKAAANVMDTAKDQIAKAAETQFKAADDVAAFGKSNVEAVIQSGSIFFHGLEELTRTLIGLTQSQVETSMSTAKSLISAKTLTEFADLQNAFAKSAFDSAVTETTKLSELAFRITNEAIEPLSQRVNAAIEQIAKPLPTYV